MNFCRKCQSDYSAPGTCNCFAPIHVGPPVAAPIRVTPAPYIGDVPYPQITGGTVIVKSVPVGTPHVMYFQ